MTFDRQLVPALATALALAAVGCGGDVTADPVAAPTSIEVTLEDFRFVGLPARIEAGTQLSVTNAAESELHELVAFRLPDDESRSLEELTQLPPPDLEQALGAPATVLLAAPGGSQIAAVGDGTLSEPGRYAVLCFIPTGVEPQLYLDAAAESDEGPPEVDGGPPQFVHGMMAELEVS